jgi:glycosyltransferase involved in cell wall biosynthesis
VEKMMKDVKKPTISLCMIVKNEEDFLSQCLRSAEGVVDEIVIVDTGSSDATLEIARSHKAKIVRHEWKEDFSDARNVSLAHATSEWVLYLDADEVLDQKSAEGLTEVLSHTTHFGFFFCIYNIKENGFVSGRHYTVRLFRNLKGVSFTGKIHEYVIPMGTRAYAGMRIYHYGYDLDPETMKRKKERNAHILGQALTGNREDPVLRYHLANTHRLLGNYEEAMEHATRGMEIMEKTGEENSLYLTIIHVLAEACCQQGEWDKAEAYCVKALGIRDDFIDALYTLARVYRIKRNSRQTLLTWHTFLEKKRLIDCEPERGFFFRCLTSWGREAEVRNDLGGIFYENGNLERAIEEVRKAIALLPHDAGAHCNLGSVLAAKGQLREAEESFKKALEIKPVYPEAEEGLKRIGASL